MGGKFKREGIYVYLWLIQVEVWQKTIKFCKAITLQLKKKKNTTRSQGTNHHLYSLISSLSHPPPTAILRHPWICLLSCKHKVALSVDFIWCYTNRITAGFFRWEWLFFSSSTWFVSVVHPFLLLDFVWLFQCVCSFTCWEALGHLQFGAWMSTAGMNIRAHVCVDRCLRCSRVRLRSGPSGSYGGFIFWTFVKFLNCFSK